MKGKHVNPGGFKVLSPEMVSLQMTPTELVLLVEALTSYRLYPRPSERASLEDALRRSKNALRALEKASAPRTYQAPPEEGWIP